MEELKNLFNLGSAQDWHYIGQVADFFGAVLPIAVPLLGIWKKEAIRNFLTSKSGFSDVGMDVDVSTKFDAIIFTVSREEAVKKTIDKTNPRWIGLVPTTDSREAAENIRRYAQEKGIDVFPISDIEDANDPAHSRGATRHLLRQLGDFDSKRVAVDVTGGTTPMSIGAFMAAQEGGVTTIYLRSEFDRALSKIKPGSERLIHVSAA